MLRRMFSALVLCGLSLTAAAQPSKTAPIAPPALTAALLGDWTGLLEYRDYADPATSLKRVQLPTWLSITQAPEGLRFHYVYDDGPNKVVEESLLIAIDGAAQTYSEISTDHAVSTYKISGLESLKDGRGELVLTGTGTDNDKPAELRITLTIRRNLLSMLEEARPAGSAEPFAFRHRYVFTRAVAPKVTVAH